LGGRLDQGPCGVLRSSAPGSGDLGGPQGLVVEDVGGSSAPGSGDLGGRPIILDADGKRSSAPGSGDLGGPPH